MPSELTKEDLRRVFGPSKEEWDEFVNKNLEDFDPNIVSDNELTHIIEDISEKGPEKRHLAIGKLQRIDKKQVLKRTKEIIFNTEEDFDLRYDAVEGLCQTNRHMIYLLYPLLQDTNNLFRNWICKNIGKFGSEDAIEPLLKVIKEDPDPWIRVTAVEALGALGDDRVLPTLEWVRDNDLEEDGRGLSAGWVAADSIREIKERLRLQSQLDN